MPDNMNMRESPASTTPVGQTAPVTPATSLPTTGAASQTPSMLGGGQPPTSQQGGQGGGRRRIHPLWIAAGAIALFGLVFGIANVAQGEGLSPAPSRTNIEETTISAIQTVDPSVVQIQASNGGIGGSIGSGEILTTSGYIVTNSHVVHGFSQYAVLLSTGKTVPAQLIGDAPSQDLAVLKINGANIDLKPIAIADSSHVQVGEFAIAVGSPLGLQQSATSGIISALNREGVEVVDGQRHTLKGMIQTSAPINPGNSGGALVNLNGQLVGIPTLSAVDSTTGVAANGIGYAIASNTMQTVVQQLTNGAVA